jgi:hypothetical protein
LLARYGKRIGGAVCFALALFVLLRGQIDAALLLGGIGAWLWGHRLFQAYLDSRTAGWRETVEDHPGAGQSAQGGAGAMTEKEAYEVLGLQVGAGEEEIRQAHRTLMKKLHPDQGGSTYLATRVNLAKDVLLRSHR